ncbi:MAG: DUF1287 domain-containing protein [Tannerella sp.]|jgi:uncharacterized protein YijF (DUF1287 family)|nr:DUF1287 domain-containing protein [Tannerella sp.]
MSSPAVFKKASLLVFLLILSSYGIAQDDFYKKLSDAATGIIDFRIKYVPEYVKIPYPGGDVPAGTGVCTDVVIRAYRKLGIDLQKEVHEDMKANFSVYPKNWGLKSTDTNIDHRRVPNLMKFFSRHGKVLPISDKKEDYNPGDIVCWQLSGGQTHIGIVVDKKTLFGDRYKLVHNIGYGQVMEDCLFSYKIIGHYRYKK